jgi:hypothetical protein
MTLLLFLLAILIYILVFLINYIKKIRIGDGEQDPNDYWKFSYDILDENEFNKSIKKVRDSDLVYS